MKPFARFVRLFERRPPKPLTRPLEVAGPVWHSVRGQRMLGGTCWRCGLRVLPGVALVAERWCGECADLFPSLPPAA